jgi:hypothetical protein
VTREIGAKAVQDLIVRRRIVAEPSSARQVDQGRNRVLRGRVDGVGEEDRQVLRIQQPAVDDLVVQLDVLRQKEVGLSP